MKRIALFLLVLLAGYQAVQADQVDVSIRFWDKAVYYADSPDQAIEVLVTVTNKGPNTYRFKLADERSFCMDFDVRSMNNRSLPFTEALKNKRISHRPLYFRDISLESMESYSFRENLRDYVEISESGSYVITLKLYPDLYRPEDAQAPLGHANITGGRSISSNSLSFPVRRRPPRDSAGGSLIPLEEKTGAVLERAQLPPDEVIAYMLDARIQGQWEKFFLYMDLESMILRDGRRRRSWQAESEEGRQAMMTRYREDLMRGTIDGEISTIPINYVIVNTRYSPNEGEVKVHQQFRDGAYVSLKEYLYTVKKRDNVWLVTGYSVMNLGVQ